MSIFAPSQPMSWSPVPRQDLGSLTVECDVGKPLEHGNAPAQLLCLTTAPLQLSSVASGDRGQARCSGSSWGAGWVCACGVQGEGVLTLPGLTLLPAAPWRRPAQSERCPGPHRLHPLPWQSAWSPGNRKQVGDQRSDGKSRSDRSWGGKGDDQEFQYLLLTLARQFSET